jgi:DNA-binding GntR family transcriptional regulator
LLGLSPEVLAARQAAMAVAEGRADDTLRQVVAEAHRATVAGDADGIRQANTPFHARPSP